MKGLQYHKMDGRVVISEDGWKGCNIRGCMEGVVISED